MEGGSLIETTPLSYKGCYLFDQINCCLSNSHNSQFCHREELGKNINADEAAAMGAVYQAAALSKAFKVKPFVVRDAAVFPIQVRFITWHGASGPV